MTVAESDASAKATVEKNFIVAIADEDFSNGLEVLKSVA
jgi:hypothetical protein